MDRRKVKHKNKPKTKPGVLHQCIQCILKNTETEDDVAERNFCRPSPKLTTTHERFIHSSSSSFGLLRPELELDQISPKNAYISKAFIEKIEKPIKPPAIDPNKEIDRIKKDQLVKTILGKYLAIKRNQILNENAEAVNNQTRPIPQNNDDLNVCFSSSSVETVFLDTTHSPRRKTPLPRARADFPTKCRSAPTNCTAHDSLADICQKMNQFNRQDNKTDSCTEDAIGDNSMTKKKLELIFKNSSEDTPCFQDNSAIFLRYEISCEKSLVAAGDPRADSVFLHNNDHYYHERKTKSPSPELYLNAFGRGEIGEVSGSSSSLKWKLIISHHGRGDFR